MSDLQTSLPYSVSKIEVAAWNQVDEEFGTPYSFRFAQGYEGDPQLDEDILKNLGASERALSILTHYEGTVMQAGLDAEAAVILYNMTNNITGSPGTQVRTMRLYGGLNAPYFGIIIWMPTDEGSLVGWGFPFCIATTRLTINIEQNKFTLPEFTFNALRNRLADGTVLPIAVPKVYEAAPSYPTDFDTFFGIPA